MGKPSATKSAGVRMTPETPKQKDPQRVETTRVAPVETTEVAEAVATTE